MVPTCMYSTRTVRAFLYYGILCRTIFSTDLQWKTGAHRLQCCPASCKSQSSCSLSVILYGQARGRVQQRAGSFSTLEGTYGKRHCMIPFSRPPFHQFRGHLRTPIFYISRNTLSADDPKKRPYFRDFGNGHAVPKSHWVAPPGCPCLIVSQA